MTLVRMDGGDTIFEMKDGDIENLKEWFDAYFKPYLSLIKICYNEKGCWNEEGTKLLNGNDAWYNYIGIGVGDTTIDCILNDGIILNLDVYGKGNTYNLFGVKTDSNSLILFFDINGVKSPNTIGKDIFIAVFTENGFVPAYKNKTDEEIKNDCTSRGTGVSCIQNYLK